MTDTEHCARCGNRLVLAVVAHPLHFKDSPAGLGECRYENVAFCERCEPQPRFEGAIEYYDQTFDEYAAQRADEVFESVDNPLKPHPFKWPTHCASCHVNDPVRAFRRDAKPWNGSW